MIIHKLKTYADPELDRQIEELARLSAPQSGSGSPVGAVLPRYLGDEYLDTTGSVWYKSTGLLVADWVALN